MPRQLDRGPRPTRGVVYAQVVEDTTGHTLVFMGATTEETADWKEKLDAAIAKL